MDPKSTWSRTPTFSIATARLDVVAGLISSTVAIPLAMAFGMFAFVTLGDEYFAYGAMAGLLSAVIAGFVCVLLGDRSTRVLNISSNPPQPPEESTAVRIDAPPAP